MATPAQIANDMAAHAAWWNGRDSNVARACRDAARVLRMLLAGERVDGRTWGGLHHRLLTLARPGSELRAYPDFDRARMTLEALRREAGQ